jgi:hypothetical protein
MLSVSVFTCPRSCRWAERRALCRFQPIFAKLGPVAVNSHVVKVKTVITDLDALARAARSLGLEFRQGQKTYKWYNYSVGDYPLPAGITKDQLGKCSHAIGIPGNSRAYEIGVVAMPDGTFSLLWDFYQGGYGLEDVIGKDAGRLTGAYNLEVAASAAIAQGWTYQHNGDSITIYHPSGGELVVTSGGVEANGFAGRGCHEAISSLGLNISEWQAKPEYGQVACEVVQLT